MMLGLIRLSGGSVSILGRDLKSHRLEVLREVGALVESPSYYPHLTGFENLRILAMVLGLPVRRIEEVLRLVRLDAAANRLAGGYSQGMKQRLGIAAALLNEPKLLALDEPTNGLDPAGIQEIRELIRPLPVAHGVTVFVSSHLLSEIEQMSTDVGIIHRGKLLFQGSMNELRDRSAAKVVVTVDDTELASSVLRRFDADLSVDGESVRFACPDRAGAARANRELVQAGCSVFGLRHKLPSLETLLLDVVGSGSSL